MKILYEDGPETISMGAAGSFKRGEPREVADDLAEALLKKQTIKFKKVEDKKTKGGKGNEDN